MVSTIHVQLGDLVEFSFSSDGISSAVAQGRVMEIDMTAPLTCAVQVSPLEPFRQLNLSHTPFKIVYGVGEFTKKLTPEMIGWEVEILMHGKQTPAVTECGVIKQVDSGLNCALIAFDDGHKDWRDLSMTVFKAVGLAASSRRSSPIKEKSQHRSITNIPRLPIDSKPSIHAIQVSLPILEANAFEWYTEGGHVELCDRDGTFREGALLSALRDKTLQLYNESRQFFEIQILQQSFKVVINGLVALKSIPLGQAVDIYSPMHAEFRRGRVLKAAELGKLTPVLFDEIGLEWFDLTSQTFKLVFLASTPSQSPDKIHSEKDTTDKTSRIEPGAILILPPSTKPQLSADSPSTTNASPQRRHYNPHNHRDRVKHHTPLPLPVLAVGHAIELLESSTKQFIKYRAVRVHSADAPHTYDLELAPSNSSSTLALSAMRSTEKHVTIDLATVKARIQLSVDQWQMYHPIVRGYRVDVYDKAERSVLNGKIIDSADDAAAGPRVLVKLKDGAKRWFDVTHTKIKLKLAGESTTIKSNDRDAEPSQHPEPMWHRVDPPVADVDATAEDRNASILTRQQSEKYHQDSLESSPLARHTSTPLLQSLSQVPSLDFRNLVRERAEPVVAPPVTSESMNGEASNETHRSTASNGDALSDLLPAMDDVWTEERAQSGGTAGMRYVHIGTGEVSDELPQWLQTTDEETGEAYILNTMTGVKFQTPGSSTSLTTTPQSSGRAGVVTLPIGPIEAARVASQMSSAVLCAEAFGIRT